MSQRVMVYVIARLIEMGNAGTGPLLDDWWVECTENGSPDITAIKKQRDLEGRTNGRNSKTSVVQYHVYYEDGGHNRFKERYYLIEEAALWPTVKVADPSTLVPTPELIN